MDRKFRVLKHKKVCLTFLGRQDSYMVYIPVGDIITVKINGWGESFYWTDNDGDEIRDITYVHPLLEILLKEKSIEEIFDEKV